MFRTLSRSLFPNPFDRKLQTMKERGGTKILLGWNRGLGDIALGLYAIVWRIKEILPEAEITFIIRKNLEEGFSFLGGVKTVLAPDWIRGEPIAFADTMRQVGMDPKMFDLILEKPSPTDWVRWQRGFLVPRLSWSPVHDRLFERFGLSEEFFYIGVQMSSETSYAPWRNWPIERWIELFSLLETLTGVRVLLFGIQAEPLIAMPHVIDLRGKTTLFEILSIVQYRCKAALLPDSGLLSMMYYLDRSFPLHIISLWADPNHGVLKQNVPSPNPMLRHTPLVGEKKDLSSISSQQVMRALFPETSWALAPNRDTVKPLEKIQKSAVILLAGGQGSRLGLDAPKGCFLIQGKSLFQRLIEKIPQDIPIAVMTSPINHEATVLFFSKNSFFDRDIHFFQQGMMALRDAAMRPLSKEAPDGNGSVFFSFVQSGLSLFFKKKGIETFSVIPVENLLADGADPYFLSYLQTSGADVVVKCIERQVGNPPMGALIERMGRLEMVEYTETSPSCPYKYSYIGMMACKMSFMEKMGNMVLPIHWVWKKSGSSFVWKGEKFIFDALPYANLAKALCYPKEQVYAPLKSQDDLGQILTAAKK